MKTRLPPKGMTSENHTPFSTNRHFSPQGKPHSKAVQSVRVLYPAFSRRNLLISCDVLPWRVTRPLRPDICEIGFWDLLRHGCPPLCLPPISQPNPLISCNIPPSPRGQTRLSSPRFAKRTSIHGATHWWGSGSQSSIRRPRIPHTVHTTSSHPQKDCLSTRQPFTPARSTLPPSHRHWTLGLWSFLGHWDLDIGPSPNSLPSRKARKDCLSTRRPFTPAPTALARYLL